MKNKKLMVGLFVATFFLLGAETVLADSNSDTEYFGISLPINHIQLPKGVVEEKSIGKIYKEYNDSSHVIFSLDLLPASFILKREVMTGGFSLEHYLVGEEIMGLAYKVETIPESLNISEMLLTFTLPNNSILHYSLDVKEKTNFYSLEKPIKFEDKGLLQVEVRVNTSKEYIVWRNLSYKGNGLYLTYHPEGNITGKSTSYFNIYKQAIPILTSYEAMMIGERMVAERGVIVTERGIIWGFIGGIAATVTGVLLTVAVQLPLRKKKYRRKR